MERFSQGEISKFFDFSVLPNGSTRLFAKYSPGVFLLTNQENHVQYFYA